MAQYEPRCTEREPSVCLHIPTNKDLQNQIVINVIVVCSLARSTNLKFSWGLHSKLSSSFCQIQESSQYAFISENDNKTNSWKCLFQTKWSSLGPQPAASSLLTRMGLLYRWAMFCWDRLWSREKKTKNGIWEHNIRLPPSKDCA